MKTKLIAISVAVVAAGAAAVPVALSASAHSDCRLPTFGAGRDYKPTFDAKSFTPNVDNPLFPLKPGRVMVYGGTKDGKSAMDTYITTNRTKVIMGVTTRVVEDRLFLEGKIHEKTSDYYAQDKCGNVWYFGEDTATYDEHGNIESHAGSFIAGRDGAQPGIYMQARPEIGRKFRQEWSPGNAEDQFVTTSLDAPIRVAFGEYKHAVVTHERTELEPGVVDEKYYAPGVGKLIEGSVTDDSEHLELIDIIDTATLR